jgi:MCM P-loop domain/Toprim-like
MLDKEEIEPAYYNPFPDGLVTASNGNVVFLDDVKTFKSVNGNKVASLTEGLVLAWHRGLMADKHALAALLDKRALSIETLEKFQIGYESAFKRYIIPIRDLDGKLVNVRRYRPDVDASQKMLNLTGHGSPPRLFPAATLGANPLMIVEGELDALCAVQNGFPAVSGTGGAGKWESGWSQLFAGKEVIISYDNDRDGQLGAKRVANAISSYATSVRILPPLVEHEKSDITDFFRGGGTARRLHQIIDDTVAKKSNGKTAEGEATSIQVIGSMDSGTNGKPLAMSVTIVGRKDPTYTVPETVEFVCTMDAGPKCKSCPMLEREGRHTLKIDSKEVKQIARLIETPEEKRFDLLRKELGAPKCTRLAMEILNAHTVEQIFVSSNIDKRSIEGADYTQRRVYNVGPYSTKANIVANLIGTTWPNPKNSTNDFYSWHITEAITSIDTFKVTPELKERLTIFQPKEGQAPIDKCREIAQDLGDNVTMIQGRERLHICMDLVWHSVLTFPWEGKNISRGWLEFIVVGDTRTGKSETAIRLNEHYRLGQVVGCEGATFAGLVGGVKQIGNEWTVQWGEIAINDRRLVVLDEVSGLSHELISQMSDIRSRGLAQLTKIESHMTNCRCRMIWISNPRKARYVDEKKLDGIDIIEDVIGNPEDIARFDFAMSVRSDDVSSSKINSPDKLKNKVDHVYRSDLCHDLIIWAWSRRPEHINWTNEAYEEVFKSAEWLGARYVETPTLIQGQSVREKIARMACALAARTYSTDESGEMLVVKREHVQDVTNFLHNLYSYENFGYYRLSKRIHRNEAIARKNRERIRKWLNENPRVLEFLLDRKGSFRANDLEEMAYMDRDDVNQALSMLSDTKMIHKDKSQIVLQPELQKLLREMEKE